MGIASAFRLRSASYGGQIAPPILRAIGTSQKWRNSRGWEFVQSGLGSRSD